MEVETQSDSSMANILTDRLGAGQRTKHIDTRYFWVQERVQDGDLNINKEPSAKTAQVMERSQSLLQYYNNIGSLQKWYSTHHGSHTPLQDDGDDPMMDLVTGMHTRRHEHRNRQLSALIVNIETDVQEYDERIMTAIAIARSKPMARNSTIARSNAKFCEH